MKKYKKKKYNINNCKNIDIDLYNLLEDYYEGLSQLEIAKDVGISSTYFKNILEEIEKDY